MTDTVIETHGLRKHFGPNLAVADLSIGVRRGEVFGFLGPNGAGKTTSIKMLLAWSPPRAGAQRYWAPRSAIARPAPGSGSFPNISASTIR